MHKLELTVLQRKILRFIKAFQRRSGYPPTLQEICTRFEYKSLNSAVCHLAALERKRAIQLIPGTARGIKCLI